MLTLCDAPGSVGCASLCIWINPLLNLSLCLSLNSFSNETSRTWSSLGSETRYHGFWLDLSPRHIGSSPKQSFGWVQVPANGFKSQSEVYGFSLRLESQFPNFTSFLTVWLISYDFLSSSLIICKSCTIPLWKHRADSGCNNNTNNKEFIRKIISINGKLKDKLNLRGKLKEARRKSGPLHY